MEKRVFVTEEIGTKYQLPVWEVVEGKGIELTEATQEITFVRGSTDGYPAKKTPGVLHETLVSLLIKDLQYKNGMVPARETATAITKLQEALFWMEERSRDRAARVVQGTYEK